MCGQTDAQPSTSGKDPKPTKAAEVLQRVQGKEELLTHLALIQKTVIDWQARWTLGLMIANGSALGVVTTVVLKEVGSPVVGLVFPSVWFFASGLLVSGLTPAIDIFRFEREIDRTLKRLRLLELTPAQSDPQNLEPPSRLSVFQSWWIEMLASACFLIGLIYPMLVLMIRYFKHQSFLGA